MRSVERGDERVSELGDALLEPERDGGERAHAARRARARTAAIASASDDGGGDARATRSARGTPSEPVDHTSRRKKRRAGRDRPEQRARDDRGAERAACRRRRARARVMRTARWRRRSGSRSSSASAAASSQRREVPARGRATSRARAWRRVGRCREAARGRSRRQGDGAPIRRTAMRAQRRADACSPAARDRRRARCGIATSRTQPAPSARSVAAGEPSAHLATMRPGAGSTLRTNGETTTAARITFASLTRARGVHARACAPSARVERRRPPHERVRRVARPCRVTRQWRAAIDARGRRDPVRAAPPMKRRPLRAPDRSSDALAPRDLSPLLRRVARRCHAHQTHAPGPRRANRAQSPRPTPPARTATRARSPPNPHLPRSELAARIAAARAAESEPLRSPRAISPQGSQRVRTPALDHVRAAVERDQHVASCE